jgi:glycosyltransferase 2 family protein
MQSLALRLLGQPVNMREGSASNAPRSSVMRRGAIKRLSVKLLGPAVALAVLLLVFARVPLSSVGGALRHARLGWVGAALAVSAVVQLVDAARLRRFTDIHHLGLSTWDVFKINMATQFYGLGVPGGYLSGIAVRCSQLSTRERKVGAGVSFVVDQVVTTAAMCTVGIGFWFGDHAERNLVTGAAIIAVFCGAMLVLTAVLAPARMAAIPPVRWLIARLGGRLQVVRDVVGPFSRLDRRTLLQIGTLAVGSNLLRITVYYLLAQAFGLGVSWVAMGWIRSVMMVATMPPVSVSGLGLREGVSLLLLSRYGIAAEQIVAFSLSVFTVSTLFGLLGGVFELGRFGHSLLVTVGKMRERKPVPESSAAIEP